MVQTEKGTIKKKKAEITEHDKSSLKAVGNKNGV